MTVGHPAAACAAAESAAQWCLGLAVALAEAAVQVGRLAELITQDWPDERGRERAERTDLLRRELGRDALAAGELGGALARVDADDPAVDAAAAAAAAAAVLRARAGGGARLGGTDASRADAERGMRIAQLPDSGGSPG